MCLNFISFLLYTNKNDNYIPALTEMKSHCVLAVSNQLFFG